MAIEEMTTYLNLFQAQKKTWGKIYDIVNNNKVGNAYIFSGPEGSGKEALSIAFAQFLNCSHRKLTPCLKCSSCIRYNKLQHEMLNLIVPLPTYKNSKNEIDNSTLALLNQEIKNKSTDPYYKIRIPKANRILIQSIRELRKRLYFKSEKFIEK